MKSYKHKYFIGFIDPCIKTTNTFQETEVSEVKWLYYDECIDKIRPYNLEKINILNKVNKVLQEYRLY
jgi:NADH pyrophosphatase NudC (nudix superfamily)